MHVKLLLFILISNVRERTATGLTPALSITT